MIIKSTLLTTFFVLFFATFKSEAKVLGRASVADLIGPRAGAKNVDNEILENNIQELFPRPAAQSTSRPSDQTSNGYIPEVGNCTCVPYHLCITGTLNNIGEGFIDYRINGPCESDLEICCNTADHFKKPIPIPPTKTKTGCGFHHPNGVSMRMMGAEKTQFGEFPWMVAVMREEPLGSIAAKLKIYKCGGALIHPQMVVTAAHCITGTTENLIVRAGEWDAKHEDELLPYQERKVQNVVIHPQFYEPAAHNDVALMYLQSPLDAAKHIGTICLPPQGTIMNTGLCTAAGWGKDSFGDKGDVQSILRKIDLPVVPHAECQKRLRTTRLGRFYELHNSFMCAGGQSGEDTCTGDGGSPFVCLIPGKGERYYQIGIVSWGIGCGADNIPGVYVNLPLFRNWIDSQMKSFGLDTSSYEY